MHEPELMQTGPETFRIMFGDGRVVEAELAHHTRRGFGLHGVPPLRVAKEIVAFLLERDRIDDGMISLGAAGGRYPEFVDELRHRLG